MIDSLNKSPLAQKNVYAVVGNPIAHSLSPTIHQLFAKQFGIELSYTKLLAPVDGFISTVAQFCSQGGKGLNVTAPFKTEAYQFVGKVSGRAESAQAVNTIVFEQDGSSFGDNTDGIGFINDLLASYGLLLTAKRILILGAGGAIRGILPEILQQQPKSLLLVNRTKTKTEAIISSIGKSTICAIESGSYGDLAETQLSFDLIINSIPNTGVADILGQLPSALSLNNCYCYDFNYSLHTTPFQQWALNHQAAGSYNGLGMLIEQAAEAFYLWHRVRPNTELVRQEIYRKTV